MSGDGEDGWRLTRLPCGHDVVDPEQVHYCDYVNVQRLRELNAPYQAGKPRTPLHPDEVQFVTVHQISELAFEQMLYELRRLIKAMDPSEQKLTDAVSLTERLIEWIKLVQNSLNPFKTMKSEDFNAFVKKLAPASGLESANFRRIELLSGMNPDSVMDTPRRDGSIIRATYKENLCNPLGKPLGNEEGQAKTRLWISPEFDEIAQGPTVASRFTQLLEEAGLNEKGLYSSRMPDEKAQQELIGMANALYKYDDAMQIYRLAHIGIVNIQFKARPQDTGGTGGTSGKPYLAAVAKQGWFFPILRAIKEEQQKPL